MSEPKQNDDLREAIIDLGYPHPSKIKANKSLFNQILSKTSFLDGMKNLKISHRLYCVVTDAEEVPFCEHCLENRVTLSTGKAKEGERYLGFNRFCSASCSAASKKSQDKRKKTVWERYGTSHPAQSEVVKEKVRKTNRERFGTDYPIQSDAGMKNFNKTMQERYGVNWALSSEQIKKKREKTFEQKFIDDPNWLKDSMKKREETCMTLYDSRHFLSSDLYRRTHLGIKQESDDVLNNKEDLKTLYHDCRTITDAADILGVSDTTVSRKLMGHDITINYSFTSSKGEDELFEFIKSCYTGEVIRNSRSIVKGYELDLYLPEMGIAFEYNGIYWHCDIHKNKNYHMEKSQKAMDNGIQLIHIWEDDWRDKRTIVERMIKLKLHSGDVKQMNARQTTVQTITQASNNEFLRENHLQGACNASVRLGLIDGEGSLVSVMSFVNRGEGLWDLVRFSSVGSVRGGFSKLLSFFKKNYEWNEIISFARLDYSNGHVYRINGFKEVHRTKPIMFYTNLGSNPKRFNRQRFKKKNLSNLFDNYNPSLSEKENMKNNGYRQIHDCGLIKFSTHNHDSLNWSMTV